ncbi:nucleotide-binding universal stress UspA family protein [Psychromicrobium silvestre]|uniref:Nucleotide-binding universal stress UspA family protein n=1 Tax=Psychromicrobium silvestre TaxID=1645614 RepID=A0A7Y9LUA2_9MICC|nr:universal stress protein [Psychromicrobium silvestre]NYE95740.1 nucleotide-binding universal stress UspA family protein [Psychromicrobium silvestre]
MPTIILAHLRGDDGSGAIREAAQQALWRGARVLAVSAQGDASATPVYSSPEAFEQIAKELEAAGLEFELVPAQDNSAEQVLELAAEHSAELIVLATRKRSPVMKLFLGSMAQQIILEADCPVLTVRGRNQG